MRNAGLSALRLEIIDDRDLRYPVDAPDAPYGDRSIPNQIIGEAFTDLERFA